MNRMILLMRNARNNRWRALAMILLATLLAGIVASLVARLTVLRDDVASRPRLAVVAPLDSPAGIAFERGAKLYLEQLNRSGGIDGRPVEMLRVDETPDAPAKVLADGRVIGVAGHLDAALLENATPEYARARLRVVTPNLEAARAAPVWGLGLAPRDEARFAANYARNILQKRLMYVIRESGPAFDTRVEPFVEVYQKFGTPVRKIWSVSSTPDAEEIARLAAELREIDVGAIYVAASPSLAARLVHAVRSTGNALDVLGPSSLATGEFQHALRKLAGEDAELQSHGIVVTTPLIFDTANDLSQRFQGDFERRFDAKPDWTAALARDAAHLALSRRAVDETDGALTGTMSFIDQRAASTVRIGVYNGGEVISAPIQLLPMARGANFNYLEALRQGRVLYVNDQFMFRTNVVYAGVTIHEIGRIDREKEAVDIDFSIWFRYRGKFDPQDIQVLNAVEPVVLTKPEEVRESDEVQYRRYRIRQSFKLNFTTDPRSHDQHIAGLVFRHRALNRSNLLYVADVLGMPNGSGLADDLRNRRVVPRGQGWTVENAWISQDLVRERGDGAPQYVGMTGEQPLFSTITTAVLLRPDSVTARDLLSTEHLLYAAIFGVIGAIAAAVVDARRIGRYWTFNAWMLRLIFWPCLLLAAGNLVIDLAFGAWPPGITRRLVTAYDALWWLLGAYLADMAIRRFGWTALESRTGRMVPNVMKFLVTILVFALASAGIVAFVFNDTLTSLLATSGVVAMIVGLAVQANIANVFSGIILNIERPFKVGDFVKLNNIVGQVKDITWRTTRIQSVDGPMVYLANSKVSESLIENHSTLEHGLAAETVFHAAPEADPERVLAILREAVDHAPSIAFRDVPGCEPGVRYRGIVSVEGRWVAAYAVGYRVKTPPKRSAAREELWTHVRDAFLREGIALAPAPGTVETAAIPASRLSENRPS
ncbi:MAG: hypothetical protein RIS35_983 [Pseudomonadota bacterium]|jgi:small-conductance mechanosensitive channel/ABC-type branched-subunit amino acid transport system substrate-binding protein